MHLSRRRAAARSGQAVPSPYAAPERTDGAAAPGLARGPGRLGAGRRAARRRARRRPGHVARPHAALLDRPDGPDRPDRPDGPVRPDRRARRPMSEPVPVWLLDVDGVINVRRPGWGGPPWKGRAQALG